jgi:hypothetical protein
MTVAPFLARYREQIVVVLGFTAEPTPRAICAGVGLEVVSLADLEVVKAGRDWPRPDGDNDVTRSIFGPRVVDIYGTVA